VFKLGHLSVRELGQDGRVPQSDADGDGGARGRVRSVPTSRYSDQCWHIVPG
jgi:hypothetical protein